MPYSDASERAAERERERLGSHRRHDYAQTNSQTLTYSGYCVSGCAFPARTVRVDKHRTHRKHLTEVQSIR